VAERGNGQAEHVSVAHGPTGAEGIQTQTHAHTHTHTRTHTHSHTHTHTYTLTHTVSLLDSWYCLRSPSRSSLTFTFTFTFTFSRIHTHVLSIDHTNTPSPPVYRYIGTLRVLLRLRTATASAVMPPELAEVALGHLRFLSKSLVGGRSDRHV
jgi:hypothetical protein